MALKTYQFAVEGTGKNDAPWSTSGTVAAEGLRDAYDRAQAASFRLLTDGRATYGATGRCGGPYLISRLLIELTKKVRKLSRPNLWLPRAEQVSFRKRDFVRLK